MLRLRRAKSMPGLMGVLVTLLVLGHVCDLPAFVDVAAHATGSTHHHDTDHQADDSQVSCDVVDATNTTHAERGTAHSLAVGSIDGPAPIYRLGGEGLASITPPPRPPLFLLHRSLLL